MNAPVILTYHSLDTSGSVISVSPAAFRAQMGWLAEAGIPVVPLERVRSVPGAVALTFDDGFRNFFEHAFPVLQQHGFPATVFVVSGYCGKRNEWPSQPPSGIPALQLMSWRELREAAGCGIRLGAHTVTHPFLSEVPEEVAAWELRTCREEIQQRTGEPVTALAYPYGDSNATVRSIARRHYELACGTDPRFILPGSDGGHLPRLDVYYFRRLFWFRRLRAASGRGYTATRRWARGIRQSLAA